MPGCVGDNIGDMRMMDLGFKGDGATACSICSETFNSDEKYVDLIALPCVHVFHKKCMEQWLKSDLGKRN